MMFIIDVYLFSHVILWLIIVYWWFIDDLLMHSSHIIIEKWYYLKIYKEEIKVNEGKLVESCLDKTSNTNIYLTYNGKTRVKQYTILGIIDTNTV